MSVMELICEKFKETMRSDEAVCRHPHDYCKFRTSCVIHFMGRERTDAGPDDEPNDGNDDKEKEMIVLRFDKGDGLLPAIVQDHQSNEILMVAYVNEEAWERTLTTGKAHYWSRSRNKLWLKGESSGHVQMIREILVDCDEDTVIYRVEQLGGAACHTGHRSCFFRRVEGNELQITGERVFDPEEVYKK